jgi:hypothetical protein
MLIKMNRGKKIKHGEQLIMLLPGYCYDVPGELTAQALEAGAMISRERAEKNGLAIHKLPGFEAQPKPKKTAKKAAKKTRRK